jgi:hypothetical protein
MHNLATALDSYGEAETLDRKTLRLRREVQVSLYAERRSLIVR